MWNINAKSLVLRQIRFRGILIGKDKNFTVIVQKQVTFFIEFRISLRKKKKGRKSTECLAEKPHFHCSIPDLGLNSFSAGFELAARNKIGTFHRGERGRTIQC
jgi:hypothetical protein